jgi:hypothetical protein
MSSEERAELMGVIGERVNRCHRPGRGFESVATLRDRLRLRRLATQRHALTCQWQTRAPTSVPVYPARAEAGVGEDTSVPWNPATNTSGCAGRPRGHALRTLPGYRIRYARPECAWRMQLIELPPGRELSHYRVVAGRY